MYGMGGGSGTRDAWRVPMHRMATPFSLTSGPDLSQMDVRTRMKVTGEGFSSVR